MLRYQSKGEVHKDFHRLTCATLHYLIDNYGQDALVQVLKNTAQKVYKTIHEGLKNEVPMNSWNSGPTIWKEKTEIFPSKKPRM